MVRVWRGLVSSPPYLAGGPFCRHWYGPAPDLELRKPPAPACPLFKSPPHHPNPFFLLPPPTHQPNPGQLTDHPLAHILEIGCSVVAMRIQPVLFLALGILHAVFAQKSSDVDQQGRSEDYIESCVESCLLRARALKRGFPQQDWPPYQEPHIHFIQRHSRCDPQDPHKVQRFDGTKWVHHWTCQGVEICKDVNEVGACQIAPGVFINKAANETKIVDPIDQSPAYIAKKCNAKNESETLAWNGTDYVFDGVCLPPYVCHEFDGTTGFAFCSHPNVVNKAIWLPWPALTGPPSNTDSSQDAITRCLDKNQLEWWNGTAWQHYRNCTDPWECILDPDGRRNGGCFAASLSSLIYHHSRSPPTLNRRNSLEADTGDDDESEDNDEAPPYSSLQEDHLVLLENTLDLDASDSEDA
ncbi:hypothetical protein K505DRAFT_342159 [Melanomma pulvis-pyrius CBS 109.77]|uniref:Uncharacterized protein n=1 Tax=Melanomma pulvis-pyrius CBS 109.77 TaxID=1314802 RepID=A0A6A6WW67_9PLEO|nr:hypothetical protein K505DRAFT_342159 [Melanomma pulvis-pyrius CBS 109.77]